MFFFIATFDYWGDVNLSILNCIERDQHGNIKSWLYSLYSSQAWLNRDDM